MRRVPAGYGIGIPGNIAFHQFRAMPINCIHISIEPTSHHRSWAPPEYPRPAH